MAGLSETTHTHRVVVSKDSILVEFHQPEDLLDRLEHCSEVGSALQHLCLHARRDKDLQHQHIEQIARVVLRCTNLRHFEFRRNALHLWGVHMQPGEELMGDVSMAVLAPAIRARAHTLTHLCLSDNRMGCKGATLLANTLAGFTGITGLELAENRIEAQGAIALAAVVSQWKGLKHLDLRGCRIDAVGMLAISKALNGCPMLEFLDLSLNTLSSKPGKALALSLGGCQSLDTFKICDAAIDDSTLTRLCEHLSPGLRVFICLGNGTLSTLPPQMLRLCCLEEFRCDVIKTRGTWMKRMLNMYGATIAVKSVELAKEYIRLAHGQAKIEAWEPDSILIKSALKR